MGVLRCVSWLYFTTSVCVNVCVILVTGQAYVVSCFQHQYWHALLILLISRVKMTCAFYVDIILNTVP